MLLREAKKDQRNKNMPNYYIYLASSLPALQFDMKLPFSFESFLEVASSLISESDLNVLKTTSQIGEGFYNGAQSTLKKWHTFDIALRNELVKIRAARKHIDGSKYLRADGYADPSIAHIALSAHRSPSILEGERILDKERWYFLDELTLGHYFDIDFLIVYALKLLIVERWEKIRTADKESKLEGALKKN